MIESDIIREFCNNKDIYILKKLSYKSLKFLCAQSIIAYRKANKNTYINKSLAEFIINYVILGSSGKVWEKGIKIGSGSYGDIFETEEDKIIKVQDIDNRFFREVGIYKKINEAEISPKFYDAWVREGKGYIVLEKMKGDMESLNIKPTQAIRDRILRLVHILHTFNITHNDIQTTNIIIKDNPDNVNNFFLFDYNMAIDFSNIQENERISYDEWASPITFLEGVYKDIKRAKNLSGP